MMVSSNTVAGGSLSLYIYRYVGDDSHFMAGLLDTSAPARAHFSDLLLRQHMLGVVRAPGHN